MREEKEKGEMTFVKRGHYIIVGWNERSRQLISQIEKCKPNTDIVMIDETLQKKPEDFTHTFVKGSPSLDETFSRANVRDADTVIITANLHIDEKVADANTVLTLLTAKGMNTNVYAIVELITDRQIKNAERAGANEIIQSSIHLSRLIVNDILFHGMSDVIAKMLTHGREEHLQFTAVPPELINESFQKAIEECQTTDSFLLGIRRNKETILHPEMGSTLLKGDHFIFYKRK